MLRIEPGTSRMWSERLPFLSSLLLPGVPEATLGTAGVQSTKAIQPLQEVVI